MKSASSLTILIVLPLMVAYSSMPESAELDEHLRFLEPLIGPEWVGGYVGEDAPDIVITLSFEPILEGKAVRYTREAAAVGFVSEAHFYWSPNRDEVLFINLNNRGMVGEGVVKSEGENVVLRGESHSLDGTVGFKTLLHIDATGVLRDTYMRNEDGQWVQGHYQEFVARK